MFAGCVLGCQHILRPELLLERKITDEYGNKIAQLHLLVDRSYWIESAIGLIKFKNKTGETWPRLVIPYAYPANVEWIIGHFTAIEMEEQETVNGKRYHHFTHPEGEADDKKK